MKYWAYFAAKIAAILGLLLGAWSVARPFLPRAETFDGVRIAPFPGNLWYTAGAMLIWLVAVGLIYLAVLDQRYRCRTCLRRLRMPLSRGRWTSVLLGSPRTEYICPFGHGTLRVADLHLETPENAAWKPIDNMWKELEEFEETHT